jgi:hypothetical protein
MALAASGTKIQTHETPDSDSTMATEESTVPDNDDFYDESKKSERKVLYSTTHGISREGRSLVLLHVTREDSFGRVPIKFIYHVQSST